MTTKGQQNTEKQGYFGQYGGMFVPPVLESKLQNLADSFYKIALTKEFEKEFIHLLKTYVGRPSPLFYAKRLSEETGSKIYLKREDLNHTGAHKINNTIGQILLAKRLGATQILAETGAGQHGVATATAAALFGIKCKVFMGAEDVERQVLNADRIKLLGAEIVTVNQGQGTLKDAVDAALGYYIEHPDAYYLLGSAVGPHPYPTMVAHFQSIIGKEAKKQIIEAEGKLPDSVIACIGGGSNAIGIFKEFISEKNVKLFAAEGAGEGLNSKRTAATLNLGKNMIFQGTNSLCLADDDGNPIGSYSVAAGLDYPGIGPEHAYLKETERVDYHGITDNEAIAAFKLLSEKEGIIPAIESAHAVALAMKLLKNKNELAIINISGRGDKDVERI
ncbi:MAG: tryptophan synthase subunit beta [Bacteroidales bacterium]|nr:tryptophan synthase subunit beta [Bacteroidales bacterium]